MKVMHMDKELVFDSLIVSASGTKTLLSYRKHGLERK
jgi:hypothetical protein